MGPPRRQTNFNSISSSEAGQQAHPLNRLYAFHHSRRFEWLQSKIAALGKQDVSILELGCNDARSLNYVPVRVHRYVGLDAGWRSGWNNGRPYGLNAARLRFEHSPQFEFLQSECHEDLLAVPGTFDMAIVFETFEYLKPEELEPYIAALSEKLSKDGCILSTMPNEKGLPLFLKAAGSKLSGVKRSEYTLPQFWNALRGRLDRVPRAYRGRRGFDYSVMAHLIRRFFPLVRLESIEPPCLPVWLSLNVGLVGLKQPRRMEEAIT